MINVLCGALYDLTAEGARLPCALMARVVIPPAVKAEAQRMFESGIPAYTVAKRLGVNYKTVDNWARQESWVQTLAPVLANGSLESAILSLAPLTEDAYDERLRKVALSVPFLISRLEVAELVAKADKVAKLVQMSREILGKVDKSRNPVISVGILSAGGLPRRAAHVELIENEQVVDTAP